jgi:hypothetical protein
VFNYKFSLPFQISIFFLAFSLTLSCQLESSDNNSDPVCSPEHPEGACPEGEVCQGGECIVPAQPCSSEFPEGYCQGTQICHQGTCLDSCSESFPDGYCSGEMECLGEQCRYNCSSEHPEGYCGDGFHCNGNSCAEGDVCSLDHPEGYCAEDLVCENGACVSLNLDLGDFETFTGTFAQLYHFESTTQVYGIDTFSVTKTLLILEQVQNGSQVDIIARVCDIDITNGQNGLAPVQVIVPDNYIEHLDPSDITLGLVQTGAEVQISHPPMAEIRGAVFTDPVNDPFVEDESDPRIIDQDEDGHPGMTLIASGVVNGEIYSVQRTVTAISGTITSADTWDGDVIWSDEQIVVGAENEALIQTMNAIPHLDDSFFYTTRIETTDDCQYIIDNKEELFTR